MTNIIIKSLFFLYIFKNNQYSFKKVIDNIKYLIYNKVYTKNNEIEISNIGAIGEIIRI